ncbi:MAG: hypothetical protein PHO15_11120, partial [Eubacteriales bacterium]|nr:hypothetical protein [Eubacteriales bacterium]
MMVLIELLIFLSTMLPLFHLLNALFTRKMQHAAVPIKQKRFSILIPCFNEADTVMVSIKGLLDMNYHNYE